MRIRCISRDSSLFCSSVYKRRTIALSPTTTSKKMASCICYRGLVCLVAQKTLQRRQKLIFRRRCCEYNDRDKSNSNEEQDLLSYRKLGTWKTPRHHPPPPLSSLPPQRVPPRAPSLSLRRRPPTWRRTWPPPGAIASHSFWQDFSSSDPTGKYPPCPPLLLSQISLKLPSPDRYVALWIAETQARFRDKTMCYPALRVCSELEDLDTKIWTCIVI